jgi:hypothetical protein
VTNAGMITCTPSAGTSTMNSRTRLLSK